MKLLKQNSPDRIRSKDGAPFTDFYLAWVYEGHNYVLRIRPQFGRDYDKLFALAETVPDGEMIEKYL